ncbi:exodeoxyribonuclease VII large subunit [Echinicola soli]|uniref:Exodeoxyribonuclease 7 large subunit n=1 Tax=Echinicola soli TaxID=2591634 RepID=A0A514CMB6_9BACT|nr:exodeoxyribonuclease VII large subunit [Echinicola soli]QDH80938.1 exodeoxyribonuclease VII large subunit [Echinicola soli]
MQNPLSLLALNQLVQHALDTQLSPSYWVIAEIGELRDSPRGHAYLELVEKTDRQILAKIRANIWSYTYRGISSRFSSITGQSLKAGMKVLAQVSVQFHEIYGLSLNIKDIDPNFTLGEKARKRQETIDLLTKEGLINLNKQFILPQVPQRIAVISSANAAGFGDFINQVDHNREGFKVHWKLYQATLQGDQAAASMTMAIEQVEIAHQNQPFDLLVIIRGGGAQLDLDCFDDYGLAKAIANTTLPVVTGIGHERDESIADIVAHTKMKTPTAVAEFILGGLREFEDLLEKQIKQLEKITAYHLQKEDRRMAHTSILLKSLLQNHANRGHENIGLLQYRVNSLAQQTLKLRFHHLESLEEGFKKEVRNLLQQEKSNLDILGKNIQNLDPATFFRKGYTKTEINGLPINKASPQKGDTVTTYSAKTILKSTIDNVKSHE